jgi:hypothetical protein
LHSARAAKAAGYYLYLNITRLLERWRTEEERIERDRAGVPRLHGPRSARDRGVLTLIQFILVGRLDFSRPDDPSHRKLLKTFVLQAFLPVSVTETRVERPLPRACAVAQPAQRADMLARR